MALISARTIGLCNPARRCTDTACALTDCCKIRVVWQLSAKLVVYPEILAQKIGCAGAFVRSGLFYHSEIIKENIAAARSGHLQNRAHW